MDECPRIIHASKYERQTRDTFNWWLRLFGMMEQDFAILPSQRKEILQQIFPQRLLFQILSLLTLKDEMTPEGYRLQRTVSKTGALKADLIFPRKSTLSSEVSLENVLPIYPDMKIKSDESMRTVVEHLFIPKETGGFDVYSDRYQPVRDEYDHCISKLKEKRREVGSSNPYARFFKQNTERVAIWRDLPPLSLEEMNLNQKAEAITEAIAIDFINWLKKIGGESQTTLDVPQVVKMFEIGFNTHAATSLVCRVKEMPAVTKAIADVRMLPQKAVRARLHQKIQEDIKAFKKPKKLMAFGTTLPSEMRNIPPKKNLARKWLYTKTDKHLENMSAVWEGITHLRSTTGFCKWLMEHPEIPRPKYLDELGMIRPSFFKRLQFATETQDSITALPKADI